MKPGQEGQGRLDGLINLASLHETLFSTCLAFTLERWKGDKKVSSYIQGTHSGMENRISELKVH